ncbi:NUDIX domain-containing protein [Kitasatospora fiedleri]|uniref:NUDIX domain-containing protein n=1 Tax=Kitasatospora fiedleri TaxID=2991545 RepID=UPI00249BD325|nr:NUDIX domain-containing protein [Kitasatospora fiedleri]
MTQHQAWREITSETAFTKYGRSVEKVAFELPDGSKNDFYLKCERPAAAVLALTPDRQVILARQFRPGPRRILHELPGGFVEPATDPAATAAAELLEETGYQGTVQPSPKSGTTPTPTSSATCSPPPTASRSPNPGPSTPSSSTRS